jgi:murein DD-endopeptidase MepM/ murein hydrolase activator NlpD
MVKRGKKRARAVSQLTASSNGTIRLGVVLAILVGVNLYVFLWRDRTSIPDVMEQAAVASDPAAAPASGEAGEATASAAAVVAAKAGDARDDGRWVENAVLEGDSMGGILRREGFTPPEADELIRALQPVMDLRKIRVGQSYRIQFDDRGAMQAFEFMVSRVLTVRAERGADGKLVAKRIEAATDIRVLELGGDIETSLYAAIKATGEETALVAFFVDVFAYDMNFYIDTQRGDRWKMLVEKIYKDGEFLAYGRVLAAEYAGRVGTFRAFWWQPPGTASGRYFDSRGRSVEKTFLKSPLKYARVSSKFNPRRMHPILHRVKGHWGVDYAAPQGTPVWAAAGGRITFRGRRGGAGNCVIINHDGGLQTIYMHLKKFAGGQRVGQRVAQKTVVGYVGMTGLATGPHLHFGVKQNGRFVDPGKIKMKPGPGVAPQHIAKFEEDTAQLVARLDRIDVNRHRVEQLADLFKVQQLAQMATGSSAN